MIDRVEIELALEEIQYILDSRYSNRVISPQNLFCIYRDIRDHLEKLMRIGLLPRKFYTVSVTVEKEAINVCIPQLLSMLEKSNDTRNK